MSCGLFKNIASHICTTFWFTICVFYFELFRCPSVSLHCFGQMHWSWGVKISHCIGGFDASSGVQQYHSMNACNDILGFFCFGHLTCTLLQSCQAKHFCGVGQAALLLAQQQNLRVLLLRKEECCLSHPASQI